MVKVLLDHQEIATAKKMKRNEVIEFDFHHDSTLEIVGMEKGAIQFNDFEILHCQPRKCLSVSVFTLSSPKGRECLQMALALFLLCYF